MTTSPPRAGHDRVDADAGDVGAEARSGSASRARRDTTARRIVLPGDARGRASLTTWQASASPRHCQWTAARWSPKTRDRVEEVRPSVRRLRRSVRRRRRRARSRWRSRAAMPEQEHPGDEHRHRVAPADARAAGSRRRGSSRRRRAKKTTCERLADPRLADHGAEERRAAADQAEQGEEAPSSASSASPDMRADDAEALGRVVQRRSR